MTGEPRRPVVPADDVDTAYVRFPKDRTVTIDDGTRIAYTVVGDGGPRQPLLFANGWSCSDAYWVHIVPPLAEAGHPCVIPDNRGHGRSGLPDEPGPGASRLGYDDLSIERMAADVVAVLDDAGIEQAVVAGHSMGVQTSLETWHVAPDRVAGLVLVAGSYENPLRTFYGTPAADWLFPVARTALTTVPPALTAPLWATVANKDLGYATGRAIGAVGAKATADDLHPYLQHLATRDPAVMARSIDAIRRHSAGPYLADIDVPVLILAATRDTFTPPRCSTRMHDRIPDSEIVWFTGAGHTLPVEEPEGCVRAIRSFLGRIEDRHHP